MVLVWSVMIKPIWTKGVVKLVRNMHYIGGGGESRRGTLSTWARYAGGSRSGSLNRRCANFTG